MGAHAGGGEVGVVAAEGVEDGAVLGVGLDHAAGGDEGAAAVEVQLLDEAGVLLFQAAVAGGVDDGGVEGEVGGVVGVEVAGGDGGLHGGDHGFEGGDEFGGGDGGDDPAGHGEEGGAEVVDLGCGLVVDVADEDAAVGDADDEAVALDGAEGFADGAAADAEAGGELGFIEAGALGDGAVDDEAGDLVRDEGGEGAAAAEVEQAGGCLAHGWATRVPMVERRLTRTMMAKVTRRRAMPRTAMAPRSPLSLRS